jgi:hypothetical protein
VEKAEECAQATEVLLGTAPVSAQRNEKIVPKRFSVDAEGAKINQKFDSGPAIRAAVKKAIAAGSEAVVTFSPGAYYIDYAGDGTSYYDSHLVISKAKGLTLKGDKTELVFKNSKSLPLPL